MTNQTSDGSNTSVPQGAEAKQKVATEKLDEFEVTQGLPETISFKAVNEATRLLAIEPAVILKMSKEEKEQASIILRLYSFHLQRLANREQAKVTQAKEGINKAIRGIVAGCKGYSFDERKLVAIAGNDAAQKYDQLRVQAQLKLDRLSYLSMKVMDVARGYCRD